MYLCSDGVDTFLDADIFIIFNLNMFEISYCAICLSAQPLARITRYVDVLLCWLNSIFVLPQWNFIFGRTLMLIVRVGHIYICIIYYSYIHSAYISTPKCVILPTACRRNASNRYFERLIFYFINIFYCLYANVYLNDVTMFILYIWCFNLCCSSMLFYVGLGRSMVNVCKQIYFILVIFNSNAHMQCGIGLWFIYEQINNK